MSRLLYAGFLLLTASMEALANWRSGSGRLEPDYDTYDSGGIHGWTLFYLAFLILWGFILGGDAVLCILLFGPLVFWGLHTFLSSGAMDIVLLVAKAIFFLGPLVLVFLGVVFEDKKDKSIFWPAVVLSVIGLLVWQGSKPDY